MGAVRGESPLPSELALAFEVDGERFSHTLHRAPSIVPRDAKIYLDGAAESTLFVRDFDVPSYRSKDLTTVLTLVAEDQVHGVAGNPRAVWDRYVVGK